MNDFSIYILVVLAIAISPFFVGIVFYGAVLYANKKYMKEAESRERQAKLEAFWKEEQLRLNPPPKRISQHTSHLEDALWEMTLWDIQDNEERKSRAAGK